MIQLVQYVLFVTGATATGLASGAGLSFFLALQVFPMGRDAGGAGIAITFLALGGTVVGAIIGFVASLRWISQQPMGTWILKTWISILVGSVAGLVVRFCLIFDRSMVGEVIRWLPATTCFVAMMGFLGGVIGSLIPARGRRRNVGAATRPG
jgi:hypothetical protein